MSGLSRPSEEWIPTARPAQSYEVSFISCGRDDLGAACSRPLFVTVHVVLSSAYCRRRVCCLRAACCTPSHVGFLVSNSASCV